MKTMFAWILALAATAAMAAEDDDGMAAAREALAKPADPPAKQAVALRDTKITADRMEYNYKESVAIMTDNVVVDDARFLLTADRLFVFMDGTNSLSQLVVMGRVAVSNENRRAFCDKAVYTRADKRLVMVGNAKLTNLDEAGKASTVAGDKITIWTDDRRMEVYPRPTVTLPADSSKDMKDLL